MDIVCIQCEKPSEHQFSLKCNHYICSKCLTKALFFINFKGVAELDRIHIVCNCQKGKTQFKTEEIVAFLQKANGISDLSCIHPSKVNTKSGLQHELYQSFLNNIVSIEDKYFSEFSDDYKRKHEFITEAIIHISNVSNQLKQKFDKAFQRAKRFFMLLKLSLYEHYNMSEEELTELIHVDDIQFKSNLNDEYMNISNIYNKLKNKKEFNTHLILNRRNLLREDKKEDFKWLFYCKAEKNNIISNMKLNKCKSERKIVKMNQLVNIDIDNVIINDYSNTVYELMKMKEKDIYNDRYKRFNTEFRWISRVNEVEYHKKDRLSLLKQISDATRVEYKSTKAVIDHHIGDCFSLQRLYQKYDKNVIGSCSFVIPKRDKMQYKIHHEPEIEIKNMSKGKNQSISIQRNRFELISLPKTKEKLKSEMVYVYDSIKKQLVIKNEVKITDVEKDNDKLENLNEKRCNQVLTNEELIKFLMTTNLVKKSFNQSLMTRTSFIPFEYVIKNKLKVFISNKIKPISTNQLIIPQREKKTSYQLHHSFLTFKKQSKQYEPSKTINITFYHSNVRRPINDFIFQSTQFLIKSKSKSVPELSHNGSFSIDSLHKFIHNKLLFFNNYSFQLSIDNKTKIQLLQKSIKFDSSNSTFSLLSTKLPLIKIEKSSFELIHSIKLKSFQICSLSGFTISSTHSSKSAWSICDNNIIYEPTKEIGPGKLLSIFEKNLCQTQKNEEEKKTIQHYRNHILSFLSLSSFKIELLYSKEIEGQTKPNLSSKGFNHQKSSISTKNPPALKENTPNIQNQVMTLKESSQVVNVKKSRDSKEPVDKGKESITSKKIQILNSSASNDQSPLFLKRNFKVDSEKFKLTTRLHNYEPFFISSKETDIEIQPKSRSPDINIRKQSLTLSLSSGSKEIISNLNGFKLFEQYNAATESAGGNSKIKDSSLNRLSEDEINLMNEIGQLDINQFKTNLPTTPKTQKKKKEHLTAGIKNSDNLLSPSQRSSYAKTTKYEEEGELNPSRVNTSNVFPVNKSSMLQYKHYTQSIKKVARKPTIPSSSIILPSNNKGLSPRGIKKYSSLSPNEDNNAFASEGIISIIHINDDLLAFCSYDSPVIIIMKNNKPKENEEIEKIVLQKHSQKVNMIINLPNTKIASCSTDSSIIIWNIQTYQGEKTLIDRTKGDILCLIYINKSIIASASFWTIQVWDFDREIMLFDLIGHNKIVISIVKLSEEQIASSSLDSTIKLWNIPEKKEISSIFGGKSGISAMVSIASKKIGIGMGDNSIKIINTKSLKEISSLKGHSSKIVYLLKINQLSLASSSKDLYIFIWNLQSMSLEKKFEKRVSLVNCLYLLKNGNLLVASEDSTFEELVIDIKSTVISK